MKARKLTLAASLRTLRKLNELNLRGLNSTGDQKRKHVYQSNQPGSRCG